MVWNKIDLTGRVFGRWAVLAESGRDTGGSVMWLCRCSCGTEKRVSSASLVRGNSTSCGCLARELTAERSRTHGQTNTRLHKIWSNMLGRTTCPTNAEWPNYGGRGITVCPEWLASFAVFARDMGPTYSDGLTLERIDVDGPYSPENCTWATRKQQARNKRTTIRVTFKGVTRPLAEWCELLGLNYRTTYYRIHRYRWSVDRALSMGDESPTTREEPTR